MNTKLTLALALIAGSTAGAQTLTTAQPLGMDRVHRARLAGTVYINLATGERRMIPTGSATRDSSVPVWENLDISANGNFWFGADDPSSSFPDGTFPALGSESLDWGDIGRGTSDPLSTDIDCYVMGYATSIRGNRTTVIGLVGVNAWYNSDSGFNDSTISGVAAIGLVDIPGALSNLPPGFGTAWILTADLSGTTLTFTIAGDDEDGGGTSDFGYSYSFDQSTITGRQGLIGPSLVLPAEYGPEGRGFPTGASGSAYGVQNAFDWFKNGPAVGGPGHGRGSPSEYLGTFFLDWIPSIPPTDPAYIPFASFPMALFSPQTGACPCDITGDSTIDVGDFFAFVACFADPPGFGCA